MSKDTNVPSEEANAWIDGLASFAIRVRVGHTLMAHHEVDIRTPVDLQRKVTGTKKDLQGDEHNISFRTDRVPKECSWR